MVDTLTTVLEYTTLVKVPVGGINTNTDGLTGKFLVEIITGGRRTSVSVNVEGNLGSNVLTSSIGGGIFIISIEHDTLIINISKSSSSITSVTSVITV